MSDVIEKNDLLLFLLMKRQVRIKGKLRWHSRVYTTPHHSRRARISTPKTTTKDIRTIVHTTVYILVDQNQ